MIQKQGNWVPYELKPRNVERRFFTCEMLLARYKRRVFLHRIVTGDEKWIHYDNLKKRKSWGPSGHASTSTVKPNIHGKKLMLCIWWDQLGAVYYELLKPNETITGALYRTQLMRLSQTLEEKCAYYYSRHDKIILLHDNARPCCGAGQNLLRNTQMGSSTPPAVFSRQCSFQLPLVPIDDACLSSTSHHMKIPKIVSIE